MRDEGGREEERKRENEDFGWFGCNVTAKS